MATRSRKKQQHVDLASWRVTLRSVFFPSDDFADKTRSDHGLTPAEYNSLLHARRTDYFSIVSMLVILLNLVTLALYDPIGTLYTSKSLKNALNGLEYFFLVFFAVETSLRMVCLGLRAVFTRFWNCLDFVLVVTSILAFFMQSIFPQLSGVTGLRAVRVLRPLRAFGRIPEIRTVMDTMVKSLKYLVDVGTLYVLFLVAMGCAGIAQFSSQFGKQCVRNEWAFARNATTNTSSSISLATNSLGSSFDAWNSLQSDRVASTGRWGLIETLFGDRVITDAFLALNNTAHSQLVNMIPAASLVDISTVDSNISIAEFACGTFVDSVLVDIASRLANSLVRFALVFENVIRCANQSLAGSNNSGSDCTDVLVLRVTSAEVAAVKRILWPNSVATSTVMLPFLMQHFPAAAAPLLALDSTRDPRYPDVMLRTKGMGAMLEVLFCDDASLAVPLEITSIWSDVVDAPYNLSISQVLNFSMGSRTLLSSKCLYSSPTQQPRASSFSSDFVHLFSNATATFLSLQYLVNFLARLPVTAERTEATTVGGSMLAAYVTAMQSDYTACSAGIACDDGSPTEFFSGNQCPYGYKCSYVANPYLGFFGFDHFGEAILSVLVAVTQEAFPDMLYFCSQSSSKASGGIFSLILIVIGCLFIVNLLVALVSVEFERCQNEEMEAQRAGRHMALLEAKQQKGGEDPSTTPTSVRITGIRKNNIAETAARDPLSFVRATASLVLSPADRLLNAIAEKRKFVNMTFKSRMKAIDMLYRNPSLTNDLDDALEVGRRGEEEEVVPIVDWVRYFLFKRIVNTNVFFALTSFATIAMVICMSIAYYGMSQKMTQVLDNLNIAFTACLTLEMIFRFMSTHPFLFLTEPNQLTGLAVVIVGWVDIGSTSFDLPVVRSLRLIVALKLLRYFPTLYNHLMIVVKSFRASLVLLLIITLDIFVFACLGLQIFGGRFCVARSFFDVGTNATIAWQDCSQSPRLSFDNFGIASITSFSIFASDNWQNVMYGVMGTFKNDGFQAIVAILFVAQYFSGVYILLNLFIAILMGATEKLFESAPLASVVKATETREEKAARKREAEAELQNRRNVKKEWDVFSEDMLNESSSSSPCDSDESATHALPKREQDDDLLMFSKAAAEEASSGLLQQLSSDAAKASLPTPSTGATELIALANDDAAKRANSSVPSGRGRVGSVIGNVVRLKRRMERTDRVLNDESNRLPPAVRIEQLAMERKAQQRKLRAEKATRKGGWTYLRYLLRIGVESPVVGAIVLIVVAVSTATLAFEEYQLPPDHPMMRVLFLIDDICSSVFILECIVRIIAQGLYQGKESYLRKTMWNWLELGLVGCNIADLVIFNALSGNREAVHAVRVLYVLRPLRVMRRSPGIRVVLRSLITALRPLKDVISISLLGWLVFAIMGVQLFGGKGRSCIQDPTLLTRSECEASGFVWGNTGRNFDHLGEAFLSLYVVSTLQGWQSILFLVMDMVRVDVAPRRNANPAGALFIIAFAVLGGFFFVSLFVSVLIRSYKREKVRMDKLSLFLTAEQEAWLESQTMCLAVLPLSEFLLIPPDERDQLSLWNRIRAHAVQISLNPYFTWLINLSIIVAIVMGAIQHYPQRAIFSSALDKANIAVTGLYLVEFVVKMIAVHPEMYFSSQWNRFDVVILVISVTDVLVNMFSDPAQVSSFTSGLRMFRAARLIRLTQYSNRLSKIVSRFVKSMYGLSNVTAFLTLFLLVYSLGGLWAFGNVAKDGSVLSFYTNFDTFPNAFFVFFMILFGGNWSEVMDQCSVAPPNCLLRLRNCGSTPIAVLLFVSFVVVGNYILLNIFIAVIVESFEDDRTTKSSSGKRGGSRLEKGSLSEADVKIFIQTWLQFDVKRQLWIRRRELLPLLKSLPPEHPFAIESKPPPPYDATPRQRFRYIVASGFEELVFIASLGLEEPSSSPGKLEFFDVLTALTRFCCHVRHGSANLVAMMKKKFEAQLQFRLKCRSAGVSTNDDNLKKESSTFKEDLRRNVVKHYAANFVADVWKARKGFVKAQRKVDRMERQRHEAGEAQKQQLQLLLPTGAADSKEETTTRQQRAFALAPQSSGPAVQNNRLPSLTRDKIAHWDHWEIPANASNMSALRAATSPEEIEMQRLEDVLFGPPSKLHSMSPLTSPTSPLELSNFKRHSVSISVKRSPSPPIKLQVKQPPLAATRGSNSLNAVLLNRRLKLLGESEDDGGGLGDFSSGGSNEEAHSHALSAPQALRSLRNQGVTTTASSVPQLQPQHVNPAVSSRPLSNVFAPHRRVTIDTKNFNSDDDLTCDL